MKVAEAIKKSKKGTANRVFNDIIGNKVTVIAYKDGSYFQLISKNGKVLHGLCGQAAPYTYKGKTDWQPS